MCHHNGSGHKMLTESARMTNAVITPSGKAIFLEKDFSVMTLRYPASHLASMSLINTARIAWWCAHSANEMISGLRKAPFSDKELRRLTAGRITSTRQCYAAIELRGQKSPKLGRNGPCPCGSGKKYKICCGKTSRHPMGPNQRLIIV
jgi:uncharacterized protein YecA (UPF0149 family)